MRTIVIIYLLLLMAGSTLCQSRLYLQHTEKPGRQKNISFRRNYSLSTEDQRFQDYRLVSFTDSTATWSSRYQADTITLNFDQIIMLRKGKKFQVIEVTAALSAIGLMITPLIWAVEGGEEARGSLEAFGTLFAVTVPLVLLRETGRNKDTRSRWQFNVASD